ncbi:MAG: hypothetical protein JNK85_26820 [Verrucomicrobiales bacterium]|nr:hypothetical protein [Verrucomicrobiales bacterium]
MNTRLFLESVLALGLLLVASRSTRAADAEGTRLTAQLLWGTNGEKPAGQDLKAVAKDLEQRLRRIFKWQKYFEIERKDFVAHRAKPAILDLSKECRLEVASLGSEEFEIQLFGKGVLVVKKRQRIVPGEAVVLGGDDKNDNAWFVVVSLAKGSDAQK